VGVRDEDGTGAGGRACDQVVERHGHVWVSLWVVDCGTPESFQVVVFDTFSCVSSPW
jgi:hypothetical protein